ncbi:capsule biosynthesis protein [Gluconobacter oxydans]|uniref:Capsule export protein n=3 Tax=Gluconobacter oxydans TaxID=442 RepID=Q5FQX4_GLUOX|nr:capsular biosynthesis protein [Gluconobacter oxydans]AAW61222.1 Capsule export protein [Gluconobacter oxydans 621H]KXV35394.1 capsular biosynthesis protein [Gluconobacter oxydans]KXV66360.1 capsular biosynthesis protein [Gluconobacter oxydans]TCW23668.1 capsular polysaccharide export protein [Gluconobacter oxydans]
MNQFPTSTRDFHSEETPVNRRFLFLQGLMGPFFERVGQDLADQGYAVFRINFNGGDRLFWKLPGATDYRGTFRDWPEFLRRYLKHNSITDILLFGDCRPMHKAALSVCRDEGVHIHVFEEGYIRPDWVTLEPDGVNGHSQLPKDPEYYRRVAAQLPPMPPHVTVPSSFKRRALEGAAYNTADILTRWYFWYWQDYRPWPPLVEGVSWLRRLAKRKKNVARSQEMLRRLKESGRPYVLFPLQLDADVQIRLHSDFRGIADAIELVVESFALNAPKNQLLVIKEHPLDNGLTDWRQVVGRCGKRHGVLERIAYVSYGEIEKLVREAQAVVTINSTTGTLALAENVPVFSLGQSIYNIPDITHQGDLAGFWQAPTPPDMETFNAFRRVLIEYCLVPGGFFSEEGLETLISGVRERLARRKEQQLPDVADILSEVRG